MTQQGVFYMHNLIDMQKKLYQDLLEMMQERYVLLQNIELLQPIGRRALADNTHVTERHVRSEVDVLARQNLIHMSSKGMQWTKEGKLVIDQLADVMHEIMGLNVLEKQLQEILQLDNIMIVPGNSDEHDWVKQEMGKACVSFLKKRMPSDQTIAVTGGTTMAAVADMMNPFNDNRDCLFVPARGGIGEKEENQANTIAAKMARQAKGRYRLLYVPDPLSETSYRTMIKEPAVIEVLKLIQGSSFVLHGIGDAITMAQRRKTSKDIIQKLKTEKAVSEAFGYYFDADG